MDGKLREIIESKKDDREVAEFAGITLTLAEYDFLIEQAERIQELEQNIEEQTETIHNQKTNIRALKNEIGQYEHAIEIIEEHIDDKEVIMQEIKDLRCENE